MLTTLLLILILLPALAHQNELDSVKERLRNIHDMPTLFEEIGREGERAVITIGILPAVKAFSANIEHFLAENKDFALEFGGFARNAVFLAAIFLSEFELGPDAYDELEDGVAEFEEWLERMHEAGLITYDAENQSVVYVGPDVDLSTEDLRKIVRLLYNLSAEVPADPIVGGELYLHGTLPTRLLAMLSATPLDEHTFSREYVEDFLRTARYFDALFRLSFRHPEKMHYEDWERELVVGYIQETFQATRKVVEKGHFPVKYWTAAANSLDRIQKWQQGREQQEL